MDQSRLAGLLKVISNEVSTALERGVNGYKAVLAFSIASQIGAEIVCGDWQKFIVTRIYVRGLNRVLLSHYSLMLP